MQGQLHKKSILRKTAEVGSSSLISKFLAIAREIIQVKYLGIGVASDAFSIAFKIPSVLRKVFAEGALSAAFIPTLIKIVREKDDSEASKLISLTLAVIGCVVSILCIAIALYPTNVILLFAPGFINKTAELELAIPLLRILIFFILFISTSALLAGAMQAKHHFGIPAWGPVILNVVYIAGLLICTYFSLPVTVFCLFLLFGGLVQMASHIYMYLKLNFRFVYPDKTSWKYFGQVMIKFLPCVFSISAMEINLLIDARFASNLPAGSLTLINLSSRFMGIALSAFAAAFSSILLSHFSRVSIYAPKRLSYYLLEAAKFIFWVTIPVSIFMSFFAYDIFYTAFFKLADMTMDQTIEASHLLIAFVAGLFFYSMNKLLLSIYYSIHQTFLPTVISFLATLVNIALNRALMPYYGALGLAIATSIAAAAQTFLFILVLNKKFNFKLYGYNFLQFILRYIAQLSFGGISFYLVYKLCVKAIEFYLPTYKDLLLHSLGLWLWIGPLSLAFALFAYITRNKWKVKLYFLD